MVIHYHDGGKLYCTEISFYNGDLIADEMYVVNLEDVVDITDDD